MKMSDGVSQAEVQPWHRLGGVEHICELRKSATVLYSIFVTVLRTIYANKEGRVFGCPDVLWHSDPQKTELWIDTELRWEDTRPDFTPAIYVCLSDIKYEPPPTMRRGVGMHMNRDGEMHCERIGTGVVSFVHVSDKAGAACALADNTENYIASFQDQIKSGYCFDRLFVVTGRTPLQKKETSQTAGKGKYVSVLSAQFSFTDAWTVKYETPILKTVAAVVDDPKTVKITGDNVEIPNGQLEIEFGNMSVSTDTPSNKQ